MKVRTYVLVGAVAMTMMASGSKNAKPVIGLNPGDLAPRIESLEDGFNLQFQNANGRYTLLNFWAAYDAESRVRNVQLSNKVNKLGADKIVMYSVSFDKMESIFAETVKADKLEGTVQLHDSLGEESALYEKFGLQKGFKNFLIDEKGMIIAANVTPEKLTEMLKSI